MNNILGFLLVVILMGCQNDPILEKPKFKTIMIKSYGEAETLPDQATFYINLNCLDKSVSSSKRCLVEKSNNLMDKLLSFGIRQEDMLTTSVDMNKSYSWRSNTRVFEGYSSATMILVTLRDIDKLDQVYSELLENRNLDLGGLRYTHSKIDSLTNEAYVDALKKAERLAEKLLTELPESEKEILKVGNVEISASMPESNQSGQYGDAVAEQAAVPTSNTIAISRGTVVVKAILYVEYQIK